MCVPVSHIVVLVQFISVEEELQEEWTSLSAAAPTFCLILQHKSCCLKSEPSMLEGIL